MAIHLCTRPNPAHLYRDHLRDHLGHGFAIGELVRRGERRKTLPPARMWDRMIPTLQLANELRRRMIEDHGIRGLRVRAAYRAKGGARYSRHKVNAALDLDLMPDDYALTRAYYRTAVELWVEVGVELEVGLGLYCPAGRRGGIRVHLDTGTRCRTWQRSGRVYIKPSAAIKICRRFELTPPTEQDRLEDEDEPA